MLISDFMRISIKEHPRISSYMVKLFCLRKPTSYYSLLDIRLTEVETLQCSNQINISNMYARLKRLKSFNTEADKTLKKLNKNTVI